MANAVSIRAKFIALLASIIVIMLGANAVWQNGLNERNAERELLEQARMLSTNMDAVWYFMNISQDLINYDSSGNYEFKGLQCSIVGRSIGALFTRATDYETSYVALQPRNDYDEPDAFERAALESFESDPTLIERYEVQEVDGVRYFRYLRRMDVDESCLQCHGEPAGEIDVTGFPKEGLKKGDLYGAISLSIPTSTYDAAARDNTLRNVALGALMVAACMAAIGLAINLWIGAPLERIKRGMEEFRGGRLGTRLPADRSSREIAALVEGFNGMAGDLQRSHDSLERTVEERTCQLKQANEILDQQRLELALANERLMGESQFKSDFLAMVSHELKTPLAASMAFTGILRERSNGRGADDQELWSELEKNNQKLLSLINSVLEMARIEAGREELSLEIVDMFDIVSGLRSVIDPLAMKKGVSVSYDIAEDMPLINADGEKLLRVLENLVGNAVKFTDAGGSVSVALWHDEPEDEIVIQVKDSGIGISEQDQKRVFEKFTQADSSIDRSYGGSGLGLAICKNLVELHQGTIELASKLNEGSSFTVHIPSNIPLEETGHVQDHAHRR